MSKTNSNSCSSCGCCYVKAATAGFVATIVMTITMAFVGMNVMKSLGGMIMGPEASMTMHYVAGGVMHFAIGSFFGVLYAVSIDKVFKNFGPLFKAVIYGTLLTFLAMYGMSMMKEMKGAAANPCNPCGYYAKMNPCNPCGYYAKMNPCSSCDCTAKMNPCSSCNCHPKMNPSGGSGNPKAKKFLMSWMNHLVYALALAYMLSCRRSEQ